MGDITVKCIWDFCHEQQSGKNESIKSGEVLSDFEQGKIIAYREIQYLINNKCSRFDEKLQYTKSLPSDYKIYEPESDCMCKECR
jgi:hypothetical protein